MIKKGLGKGLEALLPSNNAKVIEDKSYLNGGETVVELDLNKVKANKQQPRKDFNDDHISELAESIKLYGVIQPIIVIRKDENFEIIAGERRWRASKLAGLKKIPAIIKEYDDKTRDEIALIENIQREDLNIIEKAIAFKELIEKYKLTQEQLAKSIGKSRVSISNALRILQLDEYIVENIRNGNISEGHAKVLLSVSDEELRNHLAKKIIETGVSVRQLENIIKELSEPKKAKKKTKSKNHLILDIEDKFKDFFQTKVSIKHEKNKGKIVIEYYSNDDLDRILEIINGGK